MLKALLLCACLAFAASVHSQEYPSNTIKMVVSSPPGGGTDILGRLIAERLRERWSQPVVVENRGGAAGNIGADVVFKSPPDGYTLLIAAQAPLVINKSLYSKLTYDPDAFVPVSMVASTPAVLLVHPNVAARNVPELIALAKANPGKLNYATQGIGNSAHLTAELFNSMAGVNIVHIPYKGTAPALLGLLGGEADMLFGELATAGPHLSSGKLRVLAVASEKRSALLPNTPTVAETLPGFLSVTWWGIVAPPGTPAAVASKLSEAIGQALKHPDVAKRLADMSIEAVGSTPAQLLAFMKQERELWGKVIRVTGTTAN
jgi:tripartite-type tricarboxylate transporter receptor subunit TctC